EFGERGAKVVYAGLHGEAAREFSAIVAERGVAFDNVGDDRRAVDRKDQLARRRCCPGRFCAGANLFGCERSASAAPSSSGARLTGSRSRTGCAALGRASLTRRPTTGAASGSITRVDDYITAA